MLSCMFSYAILVYYLGKLYDNFLCLNFCISDFGSMIRDRKLALPCEMLVVYFHFDFWLGMRLQEKNDMKCYFLFLNNFCLIFISPSR
jgi:hypothetical protein